MRVLAEVVRRRRARRWSPSLPSRVWASTAGLPRRARPRGARRPPGAAAGREAGARRHLLPASYRRVHRPDRGAARGRHPAARCVGCDAARARPLRDDQRQLRGGVAPRPEEPAIRSKRWGWRTCGCRRTRLAAVRAAASATGRSPRAAAGSSPLEPLAGAAPSPRRCPGGRRRPGTVGMVGVGHVGWLPACVRRAPAPLAQVGHRRRRRRPGGGGGGGRPSSWYGRCPGSARHPQSPGDPAGRRRAPRASPGRSTGVGRGRGPGGGSPGIGAREPSGCRSPASPS